MIPSWNGLVFLKMKAEELVNVSLVLVVFELSFGYGIGCGYCVDRKLVVLEAYLATEMLLLFFRKALFPTPKRAHNRCQNPSVHIFLSLGLLLPMIIFCWKLW